jgi:hypothetical protein
MPNQAKSIVILIRSRHCFDRIYIDLIDFIDQLDTETSA